MFWSLLVLASCVCADVLGLAPSQQSVREGVERGDDGQHTNLDEPYRVLIEQLRCDDYSQHMSFLGTANQAFGRLLRSYMVSTHYRRERGAEQQRLDWLRTFVVEIIIGLLVRVLHKGIWVFPLVVPPTHTPRICCYFD